MRLKLRPLVSCLCAAALLVSPTALPIRPAFAQAQPDQPSDAAEAYSPEQLDALLAPVALYPDPLLTPLLMATTYPLEVVQAARWVKEPANAALKGDALVTALQPQSWDPSVKALVPFPDVLSMMNDKLDWMQQVGYAFATQQSDVMDSVQRLRRQAQTAGTLKTTEQQVVSYAQDAPVAPGAPQPIIIQPASPDVVYVPAYNPTTVYGAWPYPAYPPVAFPPPPYYGVGNALVAGLAFGVGVGVVSSLWNVATPNWGRGNVNVNVNRWNSVNVNHARINNAQWRAPARPAGGTAWRPPANGPVGAPRRGGGLPPNAVGRSNVRVPSNLVQRPPAPAARPRPAGQPAQRQAAARPAAPVNRQAQATNRPANVSRPANVNRAANPPRTAAARPQPPAFGNMNQGRNASQYANRGQQSRQTARAAPARAPGPRAGGGGGGGGRAAARHR